MPANTDSTHAIITTTGADNVTAAAILLLAHPDADIHITSMSRLPDDLARLRETLPPQTTLHLCGIGVDDRLHEICRELRELQDAGSNAIWYCGRGYLEHAEPALAGCCTLHFTKQHSNAECVFRALGIDKSGQVPLLLDLAAEYVERKERIPKTHRWWQDYIEAAAAQQLRYEEDALSICIRTLAGQREPTASDHRAVDAWRTSSGKSVPLGNSPAMRALREKVRKMAPLNEPVLIYGPSGSGKEMLAHLLHEASPRAEAPFLPVNCAILSGSSDMASDRLFGHVEGAFTGAKKDAQGAFERADGGTLFLDEVAELPLDVQTQLLRVLEEGTICPLGTMAARHVNVRVVAASNRNLAEMVRAGTFRLDLFCRLNVLYLDLPPLHDRRQDIKSIGKSILHRLREQGYGLSLTKDEWQILMAYDWPGNVRQLQNVLKRAACLSMPIVDALNEELHRTRGVLLPGGEATVPTSDWGTTDSEDGEARQQFHAERMPAMRLFCPVDANAIRPEAEVRRAYMKTCLDLCDGSWTRAAQKLEIAVNTLRKWLDAGGT